MKPNDEIKRQAMSAIMNVQTVAHIGMVKLTGGIALYAAHRWQMPKDEKAPFIESIKVVMQDGGPSMSGNGKSGNERAQSRSLH